MNNFILQEYLENILICDDLLNIYNKSKNKQLGRLGVNSRLNESLKKDTEITFHPNNFINYPNLLKYLNELKKICNIYIKKYKYSNEAHPWAILENIQIQHYKPKEGYFVYHSERGVATFPYNNRHLAFITYLNDVDDGGETEFYYQKLKIKPKKGLTIIFPADWTHTHRGITSLTQNKYIITGWYSHYEP
jgi:hypothetical protein